ncbi:MAG TPA: serine hydrolase domain-containing protein, partial [Sphingobacteriaceae bacterium]
MIKYLSALCILVLVTISTRTSAQPATTGVRLQDRLQVVLDSMQKTHKFPGVTFAAVLPNGEQINLASGLADSSQMTPMQPLNRMLAGSIGKTFFAAAVINLAEERVIDLDDPISKYLGSEPWFNRLPNANAITIRMLMNHTSGIEEYYELGDFMQQLEAQPYRRWKPVELFGYIFDRKPLFEAGKGWGYSDTNYLILGYLIEKHTGKKMYDLAHKYSIKPYQLSLTEPSLKT